MTLPYRTCDQLISTLNDHKITHVDVALYNGFALPSIVAIIEIFQKANALISPRGLSRHSRYNVSLLSTPGGRIASSSSVFVWTESVDSRRSTNDTHILFIAGGVGAQQACQDERLRGWLRSRHPLSEIVHPIGEGRLLLVAAGLTNRYCTQPDSMRERREAYPRGAPGEMPSAVTAAMRIVEKDLGPELAERVSGSILPENGIPFSPPITGIGALRVSDKIRASMRWLEANVDRPISIDDAAQVAAMSERNFSRRFKSEIGMTPSDYLLRARLNMSCRMLVESRLPIDKVARRCGIGSGGQLAKLFRKHLATTPTDYRMCRNASKSYT